MTVYFHLALSMSTTTVQIFYIWKHANAVNFKIKKLNNCVNWLKSGFRLPSKYCQSYVLSEHFNKEKFKGDLFKVQVIDKLKGVGEI